MNDLEKDVKLRDAKFNGYLNKTIMLWAKHYFSEKAKKERKEKEVFDSLNYSFLMEEVDDKTVSRLPVRDFTDFVNTLENPSLVNAIESLSNIEKTVIFLMFEKELTSKETAKILKIYSQSVSRIRKRAIKKIQNSMKGAK